MGKEILSPGLRHTSETHSEARPQTLEGVNIQSVVWRQHQQSLVGDAEPQELVRNGDLKPLLDSLNQESAF